MSSIIIAPSRPLQGALENSEYLAAGIVFTRANGCCNSFGQVFPHSLLDMRSPVNNTGVLRDSRKMSRADSNRSGRLFGVGSSKASIPNVN